MPYTKLTLCETVMYYLSLSALVITAGLWSFNWVGFGLTLLSLIPLAVGLIITFRRRYREFKKFSRPGW